MVRFFWRIAFFALATPVSAGERLNALVTAAQDFSVAIQRQLSAVQGDISPTELVERTLSYSKAKTAYFNALRAEIPEMTNIATGAGSRARLTWISFRRRSRLPVKAGKGGGSRNADFITTILGQSRC